MPTPTLQQTLNTLPQPPDDKRPSALPLFHITIAQKFRRIINSNGLMPQPCKVFKQQQLLYLSYGIASYRTQENNTEKVGNYPIVFVFSPMQLPLIDNYFPYDTGAAFFNKYGDTWSNILRNFNEYIIQGSNQITPCNLVFHIYEDNNNYFNRTPKKNPIPRQNLWDFLRVRSPLLDHPRLLDIYKFLTADLSAEGCDHRKGTIECQTRKKFPFNERLLWVAFPDKTEYQNEYRTLCKLTGAHKPHPHPYNTLSALTTNPNNHIYNLGLEAMEYLKQYYS